MVDALHEALQAAMAEGPEFRFGFLMPLTDLIDCHRLGLQATVQGLGDQNVQPLKETVTLPRALADRVSAALASASDMVLAIEYLSNQQPQDEVMAGSLYALKACVDKLDKAIGALSSEFPEAVAAAAEVAHV